MKGKARAFLIYALLQTGAVVVAEEIPAVHASKAEVESSHNAFDVNTLLRLENFGAAEIAANGTRIVFEWMPPYEEAPNIEAVFVPPPYSPLAKIFFFDLQRPNVPPQPLFDQMAAGGYWLGSLSPDKRKAAIYSLVSRTLRAGVVDIVTREVQWFDFTPNYYWMVQRPVWISDDELVYAALPDGEMPSLLLRPAAAMRLQDLWRKSFSGTSSSATVLTSTPKGLNRGSEFRMGHLVRVSVPTGDVQTLSEGYFFNFRLSPDRRFLAALKQAGGLPPTETQPYPGTRNQLVVFDLTDRRVELHPCDACSVTNGGIQWSSDGSRLAFSARPLDGNIATRQFYQYRPRAQDVDRITITGLWDRCAVAPIPLGRDDVFAVYATPASTPTNDSVCPKNARWDWFFINDHKPPTNLTLPLVNVEGVRVALTRDGLLIVAGGSLWLLHPDGTRQRLLGTGGALRPWISGMPPDTFSEEVQWTGYDIPTRYAVLQSAADVHLFDAHTRTVSRISKPSSTASLLSVDPEANVAVFRNSSMSGARLSVATAHGLAQTVMEINSTVRAIAPAKQIALKYMVDGVSLTSCLLVPASSRKSSQKLPLIVDVYPGSSGCNIPRALSEFSPYHDQILPAHGYAVLSPSTPSDLIQSEDNPTGRLTEIVLAAVDQAIKEGYADPSRLGLFGFSQGHHSALQIITETNRFRAAVASHGISDTASHYGTMTLFKRMTPDALFQLNNADRYESHVGPNSLGVKPWEDPQRYISTSPVFRADRIETPLLLIHSDFDQFPLGQSEEMFIALHRLRKEATYVTYWGEGHGTHSPANIRDMWSRVFEWFDRHLIQEPIGAPP